MSTVHNPSLSRRSLVTAAAGFGLAALVSPALIGSLTQGKSTALAGEAPETITITCLNGAKETVELEVPFDPQRIAILDLASLDILDSLGVGDRVVGMASTSIDYLSAYSENTDLVPLGTIKEADLEAVMECEPDVIFIGGRLSSMYDDLSQIAPVVFLQTDTAADGKGVIESVRDNATAIASMFGLEDEIAAKMEAFDGRIAALQEFADGKTAVVGMCTSGSFNVLGNDGRCSIIGREIGFDNVAAGAAAEQGGQGRGQGGSDEHAGKPEGTDKQGEGRGENQGEGKSDEAVAAVTATHGNEASFETIVSLDPDFIFVMDRDAAIGTEGAQLAREIMDNELVQSMRAAQDDHIVYLEHPTVWYTAEGGITALDYMLADLEQGLGLSE